LDIINIVIFILISFILLGFLVVVYGDFFGSFYNTGFFWLLLNRFLLVEYIYFLMVEYMLFNSRIKAFLMVEYMIFNGRIKFFNGRIYVI